MHVPAPEQPSLYLLPGFDPHGSRTLVRILQTELANLNPALGLRRLSHQGPLSHWQLETMAGRPRRRLTLLGWNDLVRRRWSRSPWTLLQHGLALYGHYLPKHRTWRTLQTLPKPTVLALLWPLLFWLLIALGAALSLAGVVWIPLPLPLPLRACVAAAALLGWLQFGLQQAERRRVDWLFRALYFSTTLCKGEEHDLRERLNLFADHLLANLEATDGAPITLVAHSTGCYLAFHIMERLIQAGALRRWPHALQLITLGHNPAVLARFHPDSPTGHALRASLAANLAWRDITCLDDWMSFSGVDLPLPLRGEQAAASVQRCQQPLAMAAGLTDRKAILTHQFILHFQYFRQGSLPGFGGLDWLLSGNSDQPCHAHD